ncbi:MAG TPA: RebB family R body protein [Rhizomicrobium sp.]|nr:RebB family R body protein [Rhizomicrobium sp.]
MAKKSSSKQAAGAKARGGEKMHEVLLTILGSGPSVAAFQSMLQAQAANGLMYYNAVANQQKTNILGMAMTAMTVRFMLESGHSTEAESKKRARRAKA